MTGGQRARFLEALFHASRQPIMLLGIYFSRSFFPVFYVALANFRFKMQCDAI
jgi:hypothetical protein